MAAQVTSEKMLLEPFQSAYKVCHCAESALRRVQNDVLRSIDEGKGVILLMLDLSAVFDTIDHQTLLYRLYNRFGIQGRVCQFTSYLAERKQIVSIGND